MTNRSMKANKNLRYFIFSLATIFVLYIAMVMSGVTLFSHYQNTIKESKRNDQNQILVNNSKLIADWLSSNKTKVESFSYDTRIKSMNTEDIVKAVNDFGKQNPDYDLIVVLGKDGKSLASSDGKDRDFSARPFVNQCLSGTTVIFGPVLSKETQKLSSGFASPIKENGSVSGVILTLSPLDYLNNQITRSAPGLTGEVYMVDSNGYLMTPSRFDADLKQQGIIKNSSVLEMNIQSYAVQQIRNGKNGTSEYRNYLGVPVLGSYVWLSEPEWGLIVEQNTDEAYKEINTGILYLVLSIVFLSLVSLALVIVSTIRFIKSKSSNTQK